MRRKPKATCKTLSRPNTWKDVGPDVFDIRPERERQARVAERGRASSLERELTKQIFERKSKKKQEDSIDDDPPPCGGLVNIYIGNGVRT